MNKKTKLIVGALVLLLAVVGGIYGYRELNKDDSKKTVQVVIVADDKEVFNEQVKTNASSLADLLKELKDEKTIKLDYTNSDYGMYITGMGGSKMYKEDKTANTFWTYTSDTNEQCTKADFCPSAEDLNIVDNDSFTFTLMAFE
ncbi:uncharacterized protein DUF4430 [Breznakia blatticola]|uniref:Uncharacterized protein DUF4430 n=1 Tax=Breznakia blatticola TaxID=1754012 RepID=A0A4R8ACR1_9FIRM|nr:DUF4430 domain-containing protein [Breznakia blatticola]TDW26313.1 uncharacterized protein DUF4430 [Breznakia blatticola]